MDIAFHVTESDLDAVRRLVGENGKNSLVEVRRERNVCRKIPPLTPERCWKAHMMCLLTTQQRSGPASHVHRFLTKSPFPLRLSELPNADARKRFIQETLKNSGGIRRNGVIADQACRNLKWFTDAGWSELSGRLTTLSANDDHLMERATADQIADTFHGFGPKQSRNFLQVLGLTRYEIPIDSRIVKWLRSALNFPLALQSSTLSDREHYRLVSEAIRQLCEAAGIYPCEFDAMVFSRLEGEAWADVDPEF